MLGYTQILLFAEGVGWGGDECSKKRKVPFCNVFGAYCVTC